MKRIILHALTTCLMLVTGVAWASEAAAISDDDLRFFERQVRPLLVAHCYECHATESKKVKGGLYLDSRDGWVAGGDSGPAIVPGDVKESLLLRVVRHEVRDVEMPPKQKLTAEQIGVLEQWVGRGAPDPRKGVVPTKEKRVIDLEAGRKFWSFQPLRSHEAPAVRDATWPRTAIDRFVLARLEAHELKPVADADAHTLIRRLRYDLAGLPPTPEEADAFVAAAKDDMQAAVEAAVDRLLASPEFGERWGRYWLDVARYADSNGGGVNFTYDNAWRYRDYVIAALNDDKPYDLFVREQIAGDLMEHGTPAERAERVIATGFLLVGPKPLAKYDKEALKLDVVDEQVDTMGRTFLGLTLGCARCHDHKFDPVATEDYYALAGVFMSTVSVRPPRGGPISTWNKVSIPVDEKGEAWYAARKAQLGKGEALAVQDEKKPADEAVRIRGLSGSKGEVVPRGVLRVATRGEAPEIPADASGRLQLARWLTDVQSGAGALTARVMVNRVWRHLLGEGIVRSVDNFGERGEAPTHPELLDTLAAQFVDDAWSVKRLVRRIATSRVYRLAAVPDSATAASPDPRSVDPDNRLLWRASGRRLDVEAIRDTILSISGELDTRRGGPTLTYAGRLNAQGNYKKLDVPNPVHRRGVYLPILRDGMSMMDSMDMLEVFDFADPSMVTGNRASTTVPTQALYLMNSPFVTRHAELAAERLLGRDGDDASRVRWFFERSLGRPASDAEVARALKLIGRFESAGGAKPDEARRRAWSVFCQSIFSCNEFLFLN